MFALSLSNYFKLYFIYLSVVNVSVSALVDRRRIVAGIKEISLGFFFTWQTKTGCQLKRITQIISTGFSPHQVPHNLWPCAQAKLRFVTTTGSRLVPTCLAQAEQAPRLWTRDHLTTNSDEMIMIENFQNGKTWCSTRLVCLHTE